MSHHRCNQQLEGNKMDLNLFLTQLLYIFRIQAAGRTRFCVLPAAFLRFLR